MDIDELGRMVASIDTQTKNTHDLLTAKMARDDQIHDTLHARIGRLSKTVYIGTGGLGVISGISLAWVKGLFGNGS